MKLKSDYIVYESEGTTYLTPVSGKEFNGMVRGNVTFGAILNCLKKDVTEEEIVEALCKQFDAVKEDVEKDVKKAVTSLRSIGAIEE